MWVQVKAILYGRVVVSIGIDNIVPKEATGDSCRVEALPGKTALNYLVFTEARRKEGEDYASGFSGAEKR